MNDLFTKYPNGCQPSNQFLYKKQQNGKNFRMIRYNSFVKTNESVFLFKVRRFYFLSISLNMLIVYDVERLHHAEDNSKSISLKGISRVDPNKLKCKKHVHFMSVKAPLVEKY
jgi:hypothetical protein